MTDTIESLRQQLAECQATNGKLRDALYLGPIFLHQLPNGNCSCSQCEFVRMRKQALALPHDATALNELIAERTKTQKEYYESVFQDGANRIAELTAEVERLNTVVRSWHRANAPGGWIDDFRKQYTELTAQRDAAMLTLENCRLLAARNRSEDWSKNILRFCSEIGVNGNLLRTDAAIANCKEPGKCS